MLSSKSASQVIDERMTGGGKRIHRTLKDEVGFVSMHGDVVLS